MVLHGACSPSATEVGGIVTPVPHLPIVVDSGRVSCDCKSSSWSDSENSLHLPLLGLWMKEAKREDDACVVGHIASSASSSSLPLLGCNGGTGFCFLTGGGPISLVLSTALVACCGDFGVVFWFNRRGGEGGLVTSFTSSSSGESSSGSSLEEVDEDSGGADFCWALCRVLIWWALGGTVAFSNALRCVVALNTCCSYLRTAAGTFASLWLPLGVSFCGFFPSYLLLLALRRHTAAKWK